MNNKITIYCDGGCRGNGKENNIGGYGIVLQCGEHKKEAYAGEYNTTNNRQELLAAIRALQMLKRTDLPVEVYTDSAYTCNGITSWVAGWIRNGWRTSKKTPVENKDLWQQLVEEKNRFQRITFHKVKGHADNEGNLRADALANIAMDELESKIQ